MVELATLELNAKTEGLTRGVTALKELEQQAAQTEVVTKKLTTGTEAVSKSLTMTSGNAKLFMQQLSQVAQQGAATGQWAQAFSIQIADMGGAFGVWGMAVGALATVGLPLLIGALANSETSANDLKDAQSGLNTALSDYKAYADTALQTTEQLSEKYGIFADQVRSEAIYLAQIKLADAFSNLRTVIAANSSELDNVLSLTQQIAQVQAANVTNSQASLDVVAQLTQELSDATAELGLSVDQTAQLKSALDRALDAKTAQDMATSVGAVLALLQQFAPEGTKASESVRSIADAFAGVADQARIAATAAAQVAASAAGMDTGNPNALTGLSGDQLVPGATKPTTTTRTGTRAGGTSRASSLQTQLESLQRSLMSQEEAENASYARRQATLQAALDQRKITQEQYQELSEDLWKQHNQKLEDIDIYRYGTAAEKARLFFADMASSLQSGNDGMLRASRIFGAASALINAWLAYSQTLADPTLPWWAKIPKAMAVLASGFAAVNAIKSGSTSASKSSSSSVGTSSTASSATASKTVTVEIQGDTAYANLLRQNIQVIAEALQAEAGIGGFVVA